jgi:hypothetical protein
MPANAQDWIVLALITMAALSLARRVWRTLYASSAPGCASGCGTCPAAKSVVPEVIVPLESLQKTNGQPRRLG